MVHESTSAGVNIVTLKGRRCAKAYFPNSRIPHQFGRISRRDLDEYLLSLRPILTM